MLKLISRILIVLPFILMLALSIVRLKSFSIYLQAGVFWHLLLGGFFIVLAHILLERFLNQIFNKFNTTKDKVILYSSASFILINSVTLITVFLTISNTEFSKWEKGIDQADSLSEKLVDIKQIEKNIKHSEEIAKARFSEDVHLYTIQKRNELLKALSDAQENTSLLQK